jgi:hypothetical protein
MKVQSIIDHEMTLSHLTKFIFHALCILFLSRGVVMFDVLGSRSEGRHLEIPIASFSPMFMKILQHGMRLDVGPLCLLQIGVVLAHE